MNNWLKNLTDLFILLASLAVIGFFLEIANAAYFGEINTCSKQNLLNTCSVNLKTKS